MLGYVIQNRGTGGYVNWPGHDKSYTRNILSARRFPTREAAEAECCGNERVVSLYDRIGGNRGFLNHGG